MIRPAVLVAALVVLLQPAAMGGDRSADVGYAFYLVREGDYFRAAGEFKRRAFQANDPFERLDCLLWTGRCERWHGNQGRARRYIEHVLRYADPESRLHRLAEVERLFLELHADRLVPDREFPTTPAGDSLASAVTRLLQASRDIRLRDWEAATSRLADGGWPAPELEAVSEWMQAVIGESRHQKLKSPLLAVVLSAIIPGSGQLYADHPIDALQAFFFNGMFFTVSAVAYRHDMDRYGEPSGLFAVSAAAGGMVYLANLHGARKTAEYRNYRITRDPFRSSLHRVDDTCRSLLIEYGEPSP